MKPERCDSKLMQGRYVYGTKCYLRPRHRGAHLGKKKNAAGALIAVLWYKALEDSRPCSACGGRGYV